MHAALKKISKIFSIHAENYFGVLKKIYFHALMNIIIPIVILLVCTFARDNVHRYMIGDISFQSNLIFFKG